MSLFTIEKVLMLKQINFILILFIIFFISFSWLSPNHYMPWVTSHSDFSIFLALFFAWLYLFINIIKIYIPPFFLILVVFSFAPFFLFIVHRDILWGDVFIAFIYMLGFFSSVFLGFQIGIFNKNEIYKNIALVFLFVSVVSVGIQLTQWLIINTGSILIVDFPPYARPFANFSQPNNCSTFLCIGLMACLYLYEKKYINQLCGTLLASFILFGIALTQSRTAWLFTLAFLIWWFWKTQYFQTRLPQYSIFYFIGIFIFFIFTIPYISDSLGVTDTTDAFTRASSGYLRIPMWHQMLMAIKEQPLWGYGWNQVSVAQLSVYLDHPTNEWIEHSHNILLDLLIWNGIPLGVLIIGFFTWWLYRLSQLATSIEAFIVLSMVGAVLVHAMLEYPLDYAFFLLPVGFLLGVVQAKDKNIKVIQIPREVITVFLVSSIILYIWVFIEYRIIEKDVELARFELANIGELHSEKSAPNIILLTQLREQIKFMRTEPTINMSTNELNWMRYMAYRYAMPISLYRYAQALALNGKESEAKKQLLIIKKLYGREYQYSSLFIRDHTLAFEWQNKSGSKP